jgi:hypothetical protein
VLRQSKVVAMPDGTIKAPGRGQGLVTFREVGPQLWREAGGARELVLTKVGGVKSVVDSEDPIEVMQAVPAWRSSGLNLPIFLGSLVVLVWTLVLWPLSALLRRGEQAASGLSAGVRRARLVGRLMALADVVYLVGWYLMVKPVLDLHLEVYSGKIDGLVATLELAGFLTIATAAVGGWVTWRMFRLQAPWLTRIWTVLLTAALAGVVWLAFIGNLIGLNLNY